MLYNHQPAIIAGTFSIDLAAQNILNMCEATVLNSQQKSAKNKTNHSTSGLVFDFCIFFYSIFLAHN
jgi:hypothetical protein